MTDFGSFPSVIGHSLGNKDFCDGQGTLRLNVGGGRGGASGLSSASSGTQENQGTGAKPGPRQAARAK